jgi:hypothetical protein
MAQQTAVEYLLEKLYTEYRFEFSGTIVDIAKAMEKEQIVIAFTKGELISRDYFNNLNPFHITGQNYYKQTYNK